MEWQAPGILLSARPFGEADAVAAVFTEPQGRHLGLARGALSRRHAATWQTANLLQLRWVGRLADQLGALSAELIHPTAALALDDPLALSILTAACAVADAALPEREPHPAAFAALLRTLGSLADPARALPELIRWELALLADLGYGLDLTRCTRTGATKDLAYISPRTGRAVSRAAAGAWAERLLKLPAFLLHTTHATPADIADGLRLTGHFLTRSVFNVSNQPLPPARIALQDRLV